MFRFLTIQHLLTLRDVPCDVTSEFMRADAESFGQRVRGEYIWSDPCQRRFHLDLQSVRSPLSIFQKLGDRTRCASALQCRPVRCFDAAQQISRRENPLLRSAEQRIKSKPHSIISSLLFIVGLDTRLDEHVATRPTGLVKNDTP
jgi:hypothetical protein